MLTKKNTQCILKHKNVNILFQNLVVVLLFILFPSYCGGGGKEYKLRTEKREKMWQDWNKKKRKRLREI